MRPTTLALLLSIAVGTSCFVSTRSDSLACKVTTDCQAPRVCEMGECVVDTNACPDVCNGGCTGSTCVINGTSGADVTCPTGMTCTINCVGDAACNKVTCGSSDCTISCTGAAACADITCGVQQGGSKKGRCRVECTGAAACGNVTCSNSCDCVVDGCASGSCGTLVCPKVGGSFCTGTGNNGDPCTDTTGGCSC